MHIALTAVVCGIACLGPDRGKTTCLIRREDWLGKLPPFRPRSGLGGAGRASTSERFAPATDRDFAYWSGLPLRGRARAGFESISNQIEEVRVGDGVMLAPRGGLGRLPAPGPGPDARQTSTPICLAGRSAGFLRRE